MNEHTIQVLRAAMDYIIHMPHTHESTLLVERIAEEIETLKHVNNGQKSAGSC